LFIIYLLFLIQNLLFSILNFMVVYVKVKLTLSRIFELLEFIFEI